MPLGLDGRPGSPRGLGVAAALLATYASDRIVVAGSTLDGRGTISDASHVQVAFGSAGGDLGPLRGLRGTTGQRAFALAANHAGEVAVFCGDASRTRTVWVRRPGSSRFRAALRIAVGRRARGATVAVGPQGDVLAVWEDDHRVYARHLGRSLHAGAVHRIGDGVQSQLQAAIEDSGRLDIAWETQRVSEGDAAAPTTVRFATAAPGHGFGRQRTVEVVDATGTGHYVSAPGVRLLTAGGRALLAWTGYDGRAIRLRAAAVAGGHRAAAQTLSPAGADAVLGDAGLAPGGAAVVLWRSGVAGADPAGTAKPAVVAVCGPRPMRRSGRPSSSASRARTCGRRPPGRSTRGRPARWRSTPTSIRDRCAPARGPERTRRRARRAPRRAP
ncbi:MAG: hypothetical protein ACXVFK_11430 [Solirubrobacteraceae bacterium]